MVVGRWSSAKASEPLGATPGQKRTAETEAKGAGSDYSVLPLPAYVSMDSLSRRRGSPRHVAAVGAVNLLVGVSLLALISEKWIRQLK